MKIRFLADANFNQRIVSGLLLREPEIDFELPQALIPDRMSDLQVLELGADLGRIIVTHDVRTMPGWFRHFVEDRGCPGLILVPEKMAIRDAIEDLLTALTRDSLGDCFEDEILGTQVGRNSFKIAQTGHSYPKMTAGIPFQITNIQLMVSLSPA